MKKEKSCGAVVWLKEDGRRLFLIEHMTGGHYSIPKGHVEGDETEVQTAEREIREETALDVTIDTGFRRVITYSPAPEVEKDVVFFTAEAAGRKVSNQECEVTEIFWLPYREALARLTFDSDKDVLHGAEMYLRAKTFRRNLRERPKKLR
jgi:bis(5'-nucleosidyl)-tetraphosphatase